MAQKKGLDDILKGGVRALRAAEKKLSRMVDGPEKRMLKRDIRRAGEEIMRDPKVQKQAQRQFSRMGGRIGHLNEAAISGKTAAERKGATAAKAVATKKAKGLSAKANANPTEYAMKKRNQVVYRTENIKAGGVNAPKKVQARTTKRAAAKKAAAPKKSNKK